VNEKPVCFENAKFARILPNAEDALPPEFSEDRLALEFAAKHQDDLRYVAAWGKWLIWVGSHWQFENTLAVFDMARKICREAATRCNNAAEAKGLSKAKTVAAVETLAKSDRRIAATNHQWNNDPSHLNMADHPPGTQRSIKCL
jgi:putative DNA primase/helicase